MGYWEVFWDRVPAVIAVIVAFFIVGVIVGALWDKVDSRWSVRTISNSPLAVAVFAGLTIGSILLGVAIICAASLQVLFL